MSINNEIQKINKKRKKKRNEMSLEDYAKKNNIDINITLKYEDDIEDIKNKFQKSNYLIYQSNIIQKNKNNSVNKNNSYRKDSEIEDILQNPSVELHKQASASTNNSSFDDDNKNKNKENNITKIIKNAIDQNKNYKISSAINNAKILSEYKTNVFNISYNYNPYIINNNFYGNINLNFNNFNNFNNNNNYYNNYNINLYNYKNYNYILTYNYYLYNDKLKNITNDLNEVTNQIKLLENKTLKDLFLLYQSTDLLNYIKKKNELLIKDNNNIKIKENTEKKETPDHPYFYINHDEEKQINNVLYIIEGLFSEDNLKQDFNLLNMLNRDGYASLKQLEDHPQLKLCKITEVHLKTVFSEHRENEITETVETFDDILIRNKKWIKIKKEINENEIDKIKEKTMNSIKEKKDIQLKKLLEKKKNLLNSKGEILYKYQMSNINIRQKMNQIQCNFNNINFNNYNYILNNNNNFNNIYDNNNKLFNNNFYTNYYNNKNH